MFRSRCAVVVALLTLVVVGCGKELPPANPDSIVLTLGSSQIDADAGTIDATALVTEVGVALSRVRIGFVYTNPLGDTVEVFTNTDAAGTASVTFTDVRLAGNGNVVASATGGVSDQEFLTVNSGAPASLDLAITAPTGTPPVLTAGQPLSWLTTVLDAYGNFAGGLPTITVVELVSGTDYLVSGYTVLGGPAEPNGMTPAGTYTLRAEVASAGLVDTETFDITAADAFVAVAEIENATVEAGAAANLTCTRQDVYGNTRPADFFVAGDVSTTAITFGGGAPTVTFVADLAGGGSSFTIGDMVAPLNVPVMNADAVCAGNTVADGTVQYTVQDTTAPQNVTITMVTPVTPSRADNALAPSEAASIRVQGDEIVGVSQIDFAIMAGDPATAPVVTQSFTPTPGTTNFDFTLNINAGAVTFDQVRVSGVVMDAAGNMAATGTLRHPIDTLADDAQAGDPNFFVRHWATSADFAGATGLAFDPGTDTVYWVEPDGGGNGIDLFEVMAAGATTGTLIADDIGAAGETHVPGAATFSANFSGASDVFLSTTNGANGFAFGADVAAGGSAQFTADPGANAPGDCTVSGANFYYVDLTNGMIRETDNAGMNGANFADVSGLTAPTGITVDANGTFFLGDAIDGSIFSIDNMGTVTDTNLDTNPATVTQAATVANNDVLFLNGAGLLHQVAAAVTDRVGAAATPYAAFTTAIDVVYDATFTVDIDGDGADDMNIETALILDPTNGAIYRVQGNF